MQRLNQQHFRIKKLNNKTIYFLRGSTRMFIAEKNGNFLSCVLDERESSAMFEDAIRKLVWMAMTHGWSTLGVNRLRYRSQTATEPYDLTSHFLEKTLVEIAESCASRRRSAG